MGRPLNKKYFGNRNLGRNGEQINGGLSNSQNYGDDHIGGEGIASISWSTLGSFMGNAAVAPITVPSLPAPTIPGGVQATYTLQFEVESVTTGAGKANLAVGDTFGWASVGNLVAKVTDLSGANAVFSVTASGASRGDALALASVPQDSQTVSLTKIAGSGTAATFVVDVLFRVKESSVTITEPGSGYTGTETFTFTKPGTTTGTVPAGTIVLTTDSGAIGSSTNQENAILMTARLTGGTATTVDIIRQVSTRRYKVTDGTRTSIVKLKSSLASAAGEGSIRATDSAGGTYFVTKLTSRKATVTQGTGTQFANGQSVPWTFGTATLNYSVKIDNA